MSRCIKSAWIILQRWEPRRDNAGMQKYKNTKIENIFVDKWKVQNTALRI